MKMEHFCEALLSYVTTINLYLEVIDFKHFNTGTLDDVISISDFDIVPSTLNISNNFL